jgi:hypothetical protein
MHWNGTAWSLVPSQTVSATATNYLYGVAATKGGSDVWAVGSSSPPSNKSEGVIELASA